MLAPRLSSSARNRDPVRDLALAYFAGEDLESAAAIGRDLAGKGLALSFAYLSSESSGADAPGRLLALLDRLPPVTGVELSIRPTALGIAGSPARAAGVLDDLCFAAAGRGADVTLEMQGPQYYGEVLALWREVHSRHPRLGVTIPVEFRSAEADVGRLGAEGARVRLVVGAYPAPRRLALQGDLARAQAMVRCARVLFESAGRPLIASHDPMIVEIVQELARRSGRTPGEYEFQMMMGVRPLEQRRLVDIGLCCRTYVPFGPAWYEHLSARVAARPRMLWGYARAILDKR